MTAQPTPFEIVTISRCIERILTVLIYGCSLGFGWNLFRVGIVNEQQAELSSGNWKIALRKVGPGIFFALFGVIGLIASVRAPLHVESPTNAASGDSTTSSAEGTISYNAAGLTGREEDQIKSINTLQSLWEQHPPASTPDEKEAAKKAFLIQQDWKVRILNRSVENYAWYSDIHESLKDHPEKLDRLSPADREKYRTVDRIALGSLFASQNR
jgi:hypothetical protein